MVVAQSCHGGVAICYVLSVLQIVILRGTCAFARNWWRGTMVERRSLTGELSLSCARPAADG